MLNRQKVRRKAAVTAARYPLVCGHSSLSLTKGMSDEHWHHCLLPTYVPSASARIPQMCATLPGRLQSPELYLHGPVSLDGLRATNVSRKPARYRILFACRSQQALPHGHSRFGGSQHARTCQRDSRLAHLCRLCSGPDCNGQKALQQGRVRSGTGGNSLCARLDHHRFVLGAVSMGQVSPSQGSDQTSYSAGSARQHPFFHPDYRWKSARYSCPGYFDPRTRLLLCHGPRLPRFRATLCHGSMLGLLCHSSQNQPPVSSTLFANGRQILRAEMRSNDSAHWTTDRETIPGKTATGAVFRHREQKKSDISNQQLYSSCSHYSPTLQMSLAG